MSERRFNFTNHLRERFVERIGLHGQKVRKSRIEAYVKNNHKKISGIIKKLVNERDDYFFFDKTGNNPQHVYRLFKRYEDVIRFEFLSIIIGVDPYLIDFD